MLAAGAVAAVNSAWTHRCGLKAKRQPGLIWVPPAHRSLRSMHAVNSLIRAWHEKECRAEGCTWPSRWSQLTHLEGAVARAVASGPAVDNEDLHAGGSSKCTRCTSAATARVRACRRTRAANEQHGPGLADTPTGSCPQLALTFTGSAMGEVLLARARMPEKSLGAS